MEIWSLRHDLWGGLGKELTSVYDLACSIYMSPSFLNNSDII